VVEWSGGVDGSLGSVGESVVWWDMVRWGRFRRERFLVSGPGGSVMGILMRQTRGRQRTCGSIPELFGVRDDQ
jgi:hypothetical protein